MNNINFGRVLLGGLLTGLVLNLGEVSSQRSRLREANRKTWRADSNIARPGGMFITTAVVLTFFLAIMIVWIYAHDSPATLDRDQSRQSRLASSAGSASTSIPVF